MSVERNNNNLNKATRSIDEFARELLAPLRRAVPFLKGWRLVNWDFEQGLCLTMGKGDLLLVIEFEERDDERECYARSKRLNFNARHQFDAKRELTEEERGVVETVAAQIYRRVERILELERPAVSRGTAVREILVERMLMPEGEGHYYLNPYVGCVIGCDFCYVAGRTDLSRRLEGLPKIGWGRYVDVKINAADVLSREIKIHPPGPVRISPIVTDPYQPVERRHRITRQCLEVLLKRNFTPVILTRAARVTEDIELLARFDSASVGFSIPTDDDRLRRVFEPGADPVEERFEALEKCHAAGLNTFAVIQPMLPMNPERIAERLAPFVSVVRLDRMHFTRGVEKIYRENGLEDASKDSFFSDMKQRLMDAFSARGIALHELDNLAPLLTRFPRK